MDDLRFSTLLFFSPFFLIIFFLLLSFTFYPGCAANYLLPSNMRLDVSNRQTLLQIVVLIVVALLLVSMFVFFYD